MSRIGKLPFATGVLCVFASLFGSVSQPHSAAQAAPASVLARAAEKPYIVEWVYRVKWGHQQEFFDIFKKYQVVILEKEKQVGCVTDYSIYAPSLHTGEESRWDYRVIIVYKNMAAHECGETLLMKQLFPDQATLREEEHRRWEITTVHWDLPIHVVDPKTGE